VAVQLGWGRPPTDPPYEPPAYLSVRMESADYHAVESDEALFAVAALDGELRPEVVCQLAAAAHGRESLTRTVRTVGIASTAGQWAERRRPRGLGGSGACSSACTSRKPSEARPESPSSGANRTCSMHRQGRSGA